MSQIDATFDWNYTTVAQGALQNRTIPYPRGHVLGGSTSTSTCREVSFTRTRTDPPSTDFMFYTRGSSDEFNKLARVSGDDGWSWKQILPYILKVNLHVLHEWQGTLLTISQTETLTPPADGHNTVGQVDARIHGKSGPVLTSLPGNASVLDSRVIQTTSQLSEFPFNLDMNSGNPLGVGQ